MSDFWKTAGDRWQDSLNVLLGVWLILSPWILGFSPEMTAMWNAVLVGAVIALLALSTLVNFRKWEEWAGILLGLWLIASPWVLGFAATLSAATWNFVAVGILAIALAGWSLSDHPAQAS